MDKFCPRYCFQVQLIATSDLLGYMYGVKCAEEEKRCKKVAWGLSMTS